FTFVRQRTSESGDWRRRTPNRRVDGSALNHEAVFDPPVPVLRVNYLTHRRAKLLILRHFSPGIASALVPAHAQRETIGEE
ncbi:MAG TPA: hypothetical protein VE010_08480, partial [Thermoanaerobaculia bacterium]|nr:hypothetical protein [Thermoanaerobaculia bacterium]